MRTARNAISTVTKQSAVGAEQMATASEQLNRQTEELRNLVAQFKLSEDGYDRKVASQAIVEQSIAAHNGGLSEVIVSKEGQVEAFDA